MADIVRLESAEFLDCFFPLPDEGVPTGVLREDRPGWTAGISMVKGDIKYMSEGELSEYFIQKLNAAYDLNPTTKLKPAIIERHVIRVPDPDEEDDLKLNVNAAFFRPDRISSDGKAHWADLVVPVVFMEDDPECEPYHVRTTPEYNTEVNDITIQQNRDYLDAYARQIFRYQHRTVLYMLLVFGPQFRLVRWDRAGTILTHEVDYFDHPDLFADTLWRMSLLDDERLGFDPSATRILPGTEDYTIMDAAAEPHPELDIDHEDRVLDDDEVVPDDFVFRYVRDGFRKSLGADRDWSRHSLEVPHGRTVRKFLVGKPSFSASGDVAGRGTRGFVALDCNTGRFVWLKDAWRNPYEIANQEGTILDRLNKAGVLHVPTLVCHGDIRTQTARRPQFWALEKWPTASADLPTATVPSSSPLESTASSRTIEALLSPPRKASKRKFSEIENDDPNEESRLQRRRHYRIVVQEVCIPLEKIKSGKQLLEVVYTCVTAHQDAMNLAKIMHCDVSGGNVLMIPMITPHPRKSGARAVKTRGVLADWELSQPVRADTDCVFPRARQQERMGTRRYMSVATLNDFDKAIEACDELESFFYVVLDYGLRHLCNNCTDVGSYVARFFDSYYICDGKYCCSYAKQIAIRDGRLRLHNLWRPLIFDTPLDDFFAWTLRAFSAHCTVEDYKRDLETFMKESITIPPRRPSAARPTPKVPRIGSIADLELDSPDASPEPGSPRAWRPAEPQKPKEPDEEQLVFAEYAQSHEYMLQALSTAIHDEDWALVINDRRAEGDNTGSAGHDSSRH